MYYHKIKVKKLNISTKDTFKIAYTGNGVNPIVTGNFPSERIRNDFTREWSGHELVDSDFWSPDYDETSLEPNMWVKTGGNKIKVSLTSNQSKSQAEVQPLN